MPKGTKKGIPKKSRKADAPPSGPPMHPGFLVRRDCLDPSGLTEEAFGDRAGMSRSRVIGIVNGKRPITPDSAARLEATYGVDSERLLVEQARYDAFMKRGRQRPPHGEPPSPPASRPADPPQRGAT